MQKKSYIEMGFAKYDLVREKIKGFPEVILGLGKTTEQIIRIALKALEESDRLLITRTEKKHFDALKKKLNSKKSKAIFYQEAKLIFVGEQLKKKFGKVLVICAGTSDLSVAEEAAISCEIFGSYVERLYDVGVAGIHRLLENKKCFEGANAIIVVAGMDGALPSVVGGLASVPVIAVPTSVGYGASFGGIAALLTMLNSCAIGVSVMNIDNGFGAAYQAHLINKLALGK